MARTKPSSTRFSDKLIRNIARTAKIVNLTYADTMRQGLELGLPVLRERLRKKPG